MTTLDLYARRSMMKILKTITDSDLGLDIPAPAQYREREASRSVLFDENGNIALLHVTKNGYHKLPGGGVEEKEDLIEALRREVLEEAGCEIGNVRELGIIEEFRNEVNLHQFSYCYLADVVGEKGQNHLEQGEIDNGFELVWLDLDTAIKTLEQESGVADYSGKFIQVRDLEFLKETKKSS